MTEAQMPVAAAALFQKAHGKMVLLNRLDMQLANLLGQRKRVQGELNEVHALIDDEFKRVISDSDELPGRVLAEVGNHGAVAEVEA